MGTCPCLLCRTQAIVRRFARRVALVLVLSSLATSVTLAGAVAVQRTMFPPEREVWFDRLLVLAQKADYEFDQIDQTWDDVAPKTWPELRELVREIVYQIQEEGGSMQLILPSDLAFVDFGPGSRSAVAGMYVNQSDVLLNARYLTPSWGGQSWLGTLIHELVHAQGYFVGSSPTLESQTEITATEVLAAMANLDYPGARAELLDGLRRDAFSMAYYIARFGGSPIHSTFATDGQGRQALLGPDEGMLARWNAVRRHVFTPTELARSDRRVRWWMERPADYEAVLAKYAVATTTMELDAACSPNETQSEPFQQYIAAFKMDPNLPTTWLPLFIDVPPLLMDDLAYVLRDELDFCGSA